MRDWQKMNQKQRKELFRRVSVEDPGLVLSEPRARREGSAPKTAQTVHF